MLNFPCLPSRKPLCVKQKRLVCSVHEVHIDDAQLQWFEQQLEQAGEQPVAVFTHAPIMGSGLRAVLPVSPASLNRHSQGSHAGGVAQQTD